MSSTPQASPDVALMVLNWNGADLLRLHLPAVVRASRDATVETRVYVIDNASEDESLEVIASFEDVELIAFADNRRLHAYNVAASQIECTAFMMLNNDVSPTAGVVDPMWEMMRSDPAIFAVGGEVVNSATGDVESGPTGARWERQWVLEPTRLSGTVGPVNVAYVSGGAGLYRREMFLELEGFWNLLPGLYWEDVELGLRSWLHGWRSVFCPTARFDHASGVTIRRSLNPRVREFRTYQNIRLAHLALLTDNGDLRNYLFGELKRSLRKPYYYVAAPTLFGSLPEVVRRRRALRKRSGSVRVAELEAHWRN
jgi:GT2 family glycosyltransferase